MQTYTNWTRVIVASTIGLLFIILLLFGISFAAKSYGRYQARQDASNQVVVHRRLIQVEEQKRQIRVIEAHGIAEAQAIINATLTPLYLQHEAIQAQELWAGSDNKSVIYVPVAGSGIPLIRDTSQDSEQSP